MPGATFKKKNTGKTKKRQRKAEQTDKNEEISGIVREPAGAG